MSTAKTLGIIVDENIQWKTQIDSASKKISKSIGILRRVKPFVSQKTLMMMYSTLVLPYFDYCALVWGNCNKTLQERLQKLQNRSARVITGETYETRSENILKMLNWKTLKERREQQTIKLVNKALKGKCPRNISSMFNISFNGNYELRNNNVKLALSKPKTNAMKRSFSYQGAMIWNNQNLEERKSILKTTM